MGKLGIDKQCARCKRTYHYIMQCPATRTKYVCQSCCIKNCHFAELATEPLNGVKCTYEDFKKQMEAAK